jgi:hypothetical protein
MEVIGLGRTFRVTAFHFSVQELAVRKLDDNLTMSPGNHAS